MEVEIIQSSLPDGQYVRVWEFNNAIWSDVVLFKDGQINATFDPNADEWTGGAACHRLNDNQKLLGYVALKP